MSNPIKVIQFISKASATLVNTTMESELNITPEIQSLLDMLERLNELIDENPPFPQEPGAVRFGNKAFIGWFEKKDEFIDQKMNEIFPEAGIELGMYFKVRNIQYFEYKFP